MSDIPTTDNPKIAAVAAALEFSKALRSAQDSNESYFQDNLKRFLTAYQAIAQVLMIETPDELPTVK